MLQCSYIDDIIITVIYFLDINIFLHSQILKAKELVLSIEARLWNWARYHTRRDHAGGHTGTHGWSSSDHKGHVGCVSVSVCVCVCVCDREDNDVK